MDKYDETYEECDACLEPSTYLIEGGYYCEKHMIEYLIDLDSGELVDIEKL